jgi:hypothetical protein
MFHELRVASGNHQLSCRYFAGQSENLPWVAFHGTATSGGLSPVALSVRSHLE